MAKYGPADFRKQHFSDSGTGQIAKPSLTERPPLLVSHADLSGAFWYTQKPVSLGPSSRLSGGYYRIWVVFGQPVEHFSPGSVLMASESARTVQFTSAAYINITVSL